MKNFSVFLMSALYLLAGINHFWHKGMYLRIMPPYIPYHKEMVVLSGICEIVFAILLIPETTRNFAAWAIIVLLIAIFPANIQMAIDYKKTGNPLLWLAIVRLPIQFLLIWWAYSVVRFESIVIAR